MGQAAPGGRHSRGRQCLALGAMGLVLAACSTSPAPPSRKGSASPTSGAIAFSACATAPIEAMQCGMLTVPLDYADAGKGSIRIGVIRVPATDRAHRIGSLVINPGGPGASGVQFLESQASAFAELNKRFDLVSFDPRGTADPDPVRCGDTALLDRWVAADVDVSGGAPEAALLATVRDVMRGCEQLSGRLLAHVSTADVVRDMDTLRASLAEPKLNYFGLSYGTFIGALYASTYPARVRAMVLDGDVDPSSTPLDAALAQADSLEADFHQFLLGCMAQPPCPLGPDPAKTIAATLVAAQGAPPTAPDGRVITRGFMETALAAAMYVPSAWEALYPIFAGTTSADLRGIESLTDSATGRSRGGFDHELESNLAIACADQPAIADLAAVDHAAAAAAARDPVFGRVDVYALTLGCLSWPVHGPPAAPLDAQGIPPVLLLGATGDPATPYAWSVSLQRQLHGSILLTRTGFGHTSYLTSDCMAAAANAYLETLTTPATTTCAS